MYVQMDAKTPNNVASIFTGAKNWQMVQIPKKVNATTTITTASTTLTSLYTVIELNKQGHMDY